MSSARTPSCPSTIMTKMMLVLLAAVVAVSVASPADYKLPDGKDVVGSEEKLNRYVNCLLDESKCAPEARPLRRQVPEALKTGCAPCSEEQKAFVRITSKHLIQHRPQDWKRIQDHFDKKGEYTQRFSKFLAAAH